MGGLVDDVSHAANAAVSGIGDEISHIGQVVDKNPLLHTAADVGAGFFGGPLGLAATEAGLGRSEGKSVGDSLGQGAAAGLLDYGAGQLFGGSTPTAGSPAPLAPGADPAGFAALEGGPVAETSAGAVPAPTADAGAAVGVPTAPAAAPAAQSVGAAASDVTPSPLSQFADTAKSGVSKALDAVGAGGKALWNSPNLIPGAALLAGQVAKNQQPNSQGNLQGASKDYQGLEQNLVQQYNSGQLSPAQQKQLDDFKNSQTAQIKQRYAAMGRDPSMDSAAQAELANVDTQVAAQADQFRQDMLKNALSAAGVASQQDVNAIMAQYQADQSAQKSQSDFFQQLAKLYAPQGSGLNQQTTPQQATQPTTP